MKTILGTCCVLLLSLSAQAQETKPIPPPYKLSADEWSKVNRTWGKKNAPVYVLTTDSVVHYGQIMVVNDSSLLLYENEGMFDPSKQDSLSHVYYAKDILGIYTLKEKRYLPARACGGIIGGALGTAIGASLHFFVPGNKFHPVFIAPVSGIGLMTGVANSSPRKRAPRIDTTWICTARELRDTTLQDEFVSSTYAYTVFADQLPDSATWTGSSLTMDTALTFDEVASSSFRMNQVFTPTRVYASVSGKSTFSKHDDILSGRSVWLFNAGFRINRRWSIDLYYSENESQVKMNSVVGGFAALSGANTAVSCSYAIVQHDRINLGRVQCNAGVGFAYSMINLREATVPGRSLMNAESYGFMCKADIAVFLTRRIALVADVQHTFLQPLTLSSFDWMQPQGIITVPGEVITTSHFQMGVGLRVHL